jgi:hypothetical protein
LCGCFFSTFFRTFDAKIRYYTRKDENDNSTCCLVLDSISRGSCAGGPGAGGGQAFRCVRAGTPFRSKGGAPDRPFRLYQECRYLQRRAIRSDREQRRHRQAMGRRKRHHAPHIRGQWSRQIRTGRTTGGDLRRGVAEYGRTVADPKTTISFRVLCRETTRMC